MYKHFAISGVTGVSINEMKMMNMPTLKKIHNQLVLIKKKIPLLKIHAGKGWGKRSRGLNAEQRIKIV